MTLSVYTLRHGRVDNAKVEQGAIEGKGW